MGEGLKIMVSRAIMVVTRGHRFRGVTRAETLTKVSIQTNLWMATKSFSSWTSETCTNSRWKQQPKRRADKSTPLSRRTKLRNSSWGGPTVQPTSLERRARTRPRPAAPTLEPRAPRCPRSSIAVRASWCQRSLISSLNLNSTWTFRSVEDMCRILIW